MREEIYPCTITFDRYSGVYSGGEWLAWNCFPAEIPDAVEAEDPACAAFWSSYKGLVGKGDTPYEALADLRDSLALDI